MLVKRIVRKTGTSTGHMALETTCGVGINAEEIDLIYLIVDALSPYNIILGIHPSRH